MVWFVIAFVFSALLDLFDLGRQSDREKDLEILILRHQLDILERKRRDQEKTGATSRNREKFNSSIVGISVEVCTSLSLPAF
jgi:hypothetical protein